MVEVADTEASRERGLSGHAPLNDSEGMLFVFDTDARWGIWMKDMSFPLDIVWADAGGRIVHIERDVSPDTYPRIFAPPVPARYVVELPAGSVAKHAIAETSKIVL